MHGLKSILFRVRIKRDIIIKEVFKIMAIRQLQSGKFQITFYVEGRKKRESYPNKTLAKQALYKRKVEIAEGRFLDKKKDGKVRFEEFARTFIDVYAKPNKKSWERDELSIRHLTKRFGGKTLMNITIYDVENYKKERSKEASPATVNRELACLKTIFNKAIEWEKTEYNPVKKVKLFREDNKRWRYLEKDEINKILENANEPLKSIIIVALNTGMRQGEIIKLKWLDVDLSNRLIYIRTENAKSGVGRELPMNEILYDLFFSLRMQNEMSAEPSTCLFTCKQEWVKHKFHELMAELGIKDFRFHDLRHTFASHLAMMGVNIKTIQELLGHQTFQMTLRYAHLSKDHKRGVLDAYGKQMDTFWTPADRHEVDRAGGMGYNPLTDKGLQESAGVVEWQTRRTQNPVGATS
jgi:integrase